MNQGASPCAGGVPGACDVMHYPDYMWLGVALLVILLICIVAFTFFRKIGLKKSLAVLLAWALLALGFGLIVFANTETEGDRTQKGTEYCRNSGNPTCEY